VALNTSVQWYLDQWSTELFLFLALKSSLRLSSSSLRGSGMREMDSKWLERLPTVVPTPALEQELRGDVRDGLVSPEVYRQILDAITSRRSGIQPFARSLPY